MATVDERLNRMIEIAEETGLSLDEVVRAIGYVDMNTFRTFSDNPSSLPRYIASRVRP
jgi:transcriptional regulator GlxA family with amidase domain